MQTRIAPPEAVDIASDANAGKIAATLDETGSRVMTEEIAGQPIAEPELDVDRAGRERSRFEARTPFDQEEITRARAEQTAIPSTHLINTPERRTLRDGIVASRYGRGARNKERQAFIALGGPASGKTSRLVAPLAAAEGALVVDPDLYKIDLPEFAGGQHAGPVHEESKLLATRVANIATKNGDNLVLPMSGRSTEGVAKIIGELRGRGYDIHLRLMDVSAQTSVARALQRWKEGEIIDGRRINRFVDPDYILNEVQDNPSKTYFAIRNAEGVSSYEAWSNEAEQPTLIESSLADGVDGGGTGPTWSIQARRRIRVLGQDGIRTGENASRRGGDGASLESVQNLDKRPEIETVSEEFAAAWPRIEQDLKRRLSRLGLFDVHVKLRKEIIAVINGKSTPARGRYLARVIEIAMNQESPAWALDHEAIHAMRELGLFRDSEWAALTRAVAADKALEERTRAAYPHLGREALLEEMVANRFADWAAARRDEPAGPLKRAFARAKAALVAIWDALRGHRFETPDSVFRRVERGEVGARERGEFTFPPDMARTAKPAGPVRNEKFAIDQPSAVEPIREASTLAQARKAALEFVGRPLENNATGVVATVSSGSLSKMLSKSAVSKSASPSLHSMAVANIDSLFRNAVLERAEQDRNADPNIAGIPRFSVQMGGESPATVRMIVKEFAQREQGNRIYSIEAVQIKEPAGIWADADIFRPTSAPQASSTEIMADAPAEIKPPTVDPIAKMKREQEAFRAMPRFRDEAPVGREDATYAEAGIPSMRFRYRVVPLTDLTRSHVAGLVK